MKKPVGRVYILTNQAMPGLVKIGFTKNSVEDRVKELFTTGVPSEFSIAFQIECRDPEGVEQAIHEHLDSNRHGNNREFFRVEPVVAAKIVKEIAYSISEEVFGFETELKFDNLNFDKKTHHLSEVIEQGLSIKEWNQILTLDWNSYVSREFSKKEFQSITVWEKLSYKIKHPDHAHRSSLIKKKYFLIENKFSILCKINFDDVNGLGNILNIEENSDKKFSVYAHPAFDLVYKYILENIAYDGN